MISPTNRITTRPPPAPVQRVARHVESGGMIRYEIPGMLPASGTIVGACVFFVVFGLLPLLIGTGVFEVDGKSSRNAWMVAFGSMVGFIAAGAIVFVLRMRSKRVWLRFHPGGLRMERETIWKLECRDFTPRELVSLEVVELFENNNRPVPGLALGTTTETIRFAGGIPMPDAAWVRWDFARHLGIWAAAQGQPVNLAGALSLATRLSIRHEPDGSRRIEIAPLARWAPQYWLTLGIVVGVAVFWVGPWEPGEFSRWQAIKASLVGLLVVVEFIKALRERNARESLSLAPHALIHECDWLGLRRREIPRGEVAGIEMQRFSLHRGRTIGRAWWPTRLVIATTRRRMRVGLRLSEHDQKWILAEVQAWLAAGLGG